MLGAFSLAVELDGADDDMKQFSKLKDMYQPLTDWWTEKLTVRLSAPGLRELQSPRDRLSHQSWWSLRSSVFFRETRKS